MTRLGPNADVTVLGGMLQKAAIRDVLNRRRKHSRNGMLSPAEFKEEQKMSTEGDKKLAAIHTSCRSRHFLTQIER